MEDYALKVENISKKFRIGANVHGTLRQTLSSLFQKSDQLDFWALKDVSFNLQKGDALGIIGDNGAGKSTLLKILSKITYPTSGRIEMNGRLSSLLEVGTGFHPELTGRENIFLNGSLLGMTKAEINSKFDEIVDFSGIEQFIDTPVKHYSSGMYTRLAFSVAAHLNTEILLVDEVLAVGDSTFQNKCLGKMGDITDSGRTVILVSHNHSHLQNLCNSFLRLDKGRIVAQGNSLKEVRIEDDYSIPKKLLTKTSIVESIQILSSKEETFIQSGDDVKIIIKNKTFEGLDHQLLRLEIVDNLGGVKLILNNRLLDHKIDFRRGAKTTIDLKNLPLHPGVYYINILLKDSITKIDFTEEPFPFEVNPSTDQKETNAKSQVFGTYKYSSIPK